MKSKKLKYPTLSVFLFVVIGMFFISCGSKTEDQSQNATGEVSVTTTEDSGPAKVGAFILSTNPSAKYFEQGAELLNNNSFELKFFDASKGNSANAEVLKSLIEKDKSPLALYWSVEEAKEVAPYLTSSEAVGLVIAEVNKKVIPLGANIFGFGYSNELTFKQMAKYAGNTLKSYRFAVITANEDRYDLQSKVFIEESKSLGNTIVFEEKVAANISDFNSHITRATKENCDTIFAVLPTTALINFIKTAKTNKFKGKILVGDTLFASDITSLGQDAEGIYMTQVWSDDANLKSMYSAKYGNSLDGISLGFVALGYDTVKCLQGISSPLDAYTIKNSLLATSCEGITGKTQFTGERVAQRRKKILTVKAGQLLLSE